MNNIEIITDCQDSALLQTLKMAAQRTIQCAPEFAGADALIVDFSIVSAEQMRKLNLSARKIDDATDVLSFPYLKLGLPFSRQNNPYDYVEGEGLMLGQVVICQEIARAQSEEFGHSYSNEMEYLFVHSLLHLAGYDHIDSAQKQRMRAMEKQITGRE